MPKLSPLPWRACQKECESKQGEGTHAAMLDANGQVIFDTLNSWVSYLNIVSEGEGKTVWIDAQGGVDLNKVAQVMNAFATIKDPAKFIETFDAMAKEFLAMKELIGEPRNALMQMIDKAIFYREEK